MSDPSKSVPAEETKKSEAERKRRQALVFGDVLPDGTRDERSDGWGERERGRDDDWFRDEVPPHHG